MLSSSAPAVPVTPGEGALLLLPPNRPNLSRNTQLASLPLGRKTHTCRLAKVGLETRDLTFFAEIHGVGPGGGVGAGGYDSSVISDKGRGQDGRETHGYATGMLTWVFGWSALLECPGHGGLRAEGPAPNTVISWTPDCIRTGQRRKAVPSHPYRGLALGKLF